MTFIKSTFCLAGLLFAPWSFGAVTYTYTGHILRCYSPSPGCTSGGFISGSITLPAPLAPNTPLGNLDSEVIFATLSDNGAFGLTLNTLNEVHENINLGTDSSGDVNAWVWGFDNYTPGTGGLYEDLVTISGPTGATDGSEFNLNEANTGNTEAALNYGNPGSWTEAVNVPEPNAMLLLCVGLVGVAATVRKR